MILYPFSVACPDCGAVKGSFCGEELGKHGREACDARWLATGVAQFEIPKSAANPSAREAAFRAGYLAACDITEYDVDTAWTEYVKALS